jgi:hypothetical protein
MPPVSRPFRRRRSLHENAVRSVGAEQDRPTDVHTSEKSFQKIYSQIRNNSVKLSCSISGRKNTADYLGGILSSGNHHVPSGEDGCFLQKRKVVITRSAKQRRRQTDRREGVPPGIKKDPADTNRRDLPSGNTRILLTESLRRFCRWGCTAEGFPLRRLHR